MILLQRKRKPFYLTLTILFLLSLGGAFVNISGTEAGDASVAWTSGIQPLGDLNIGDRVVDSSWEWQFRSGDDYTYQDGDVTKPVTWIVVAKEHYDGLGSHVTLLSEALIGKHAFDDSTNRGSGWGDNHWGDSGSPDAERGIRKFLNGSSYTGDDENEYAVTFYDAMSEHFQEAVLAITLSNRVWPTGAEYTTTDKVFLPSSTELGDGDSSPYEIGNVYPYFAGAEDEDRIAELPGGFAWYWTRSPESMAASTMRGVSQLGNFLMIDTTWADDVTARPALNLSSETLVSVVTNDDGAYEIITPPTIWVEPENNLIRSSYWVPPATITVTIKDGDTVVFEDTENTHPAGWFVLETDYDILAGDLVILSDGIMTVEHLVSSLQVTSVDFWGNGTVRGTAAPGSLVEVFIWAGWQGPIHELKVIAESNGDWTASFGFPIGQDQIYVWQMDQDRNRTVIIRDPLPYFNVFREENRISGSYWEPNSSVTVTIHDGASLVFEESVNVDEYGFSLEPGSYQIQPGNLVTVTDGVVTKEHLVTPLTITEINLENNTISGTASPDYFVMVGIGVSGPYVQSLGTQPGPNGVWNLNFDQVWDYGEEKYVDFSLRPGHQGGAWQTDHEGDQTVIRWHILLNGDVNEDGQIDVSDATLILDHISGLITLTGNRLIVADVNQNGEVDLADALLLLRYIVGLEPSLP